MPSLLQKSTHVAMQTPFSRTFFLFLRIILRNLIAITLWFFPFLAFAAAEKEPNPSDPDAITIRAEQMTGRPYRILKFRRPGRSGSG